MTSFVKSMVDRMWAEDEYDPDVIAWLEADPEPPLTREELAELEWQEVQCRLADLGMYD